MKHKSYSKRMAHFKKKYKHLATAFAGAMLMSSALLPGLPMPSAHAAANRKDMSLLNEDGNQVAVVEQSTNPNQDVVVKNLNGGEGRTSNGFLLPSEGGVNKAAMAERSTNPNQDVVTKNLNGGEGKTSNGFFLPSEGGNNPYMAERSINPNQDSVRRFQTPIRERWQGNQKQPPSAVPADYKQVIDITATAYSPGRLDNDQWGNKTRMGTIIRPGVIAVDPDVIPLGSKVYVQYSDGHGEYKVAEDTGGAIKGHRIDIAMMDRGNAKDFGIQPVKVYVVDTPNET